MQSRVKAFAKRLLPAGVHHQLRHWLKNSPRILEKRRTEQAFANAPLEPAYLPSDVLDMLMTRYARPPRYGSDARSLELRGASRAAELLRVPGVREASSTLELGCWDGMVSLNLARRGKRATAIDYRGQGFDQRAARGGVRLLLMDAAQLQFDAETFDLVFSYDAFEHFDSPQSVLHEALRVARPGGYIYLEFGPLYYSPYGEHAYHSIPVPYCQFLFTEEQINGCAAKNNRAVIDFTHVNRWSLEQYRALWDKYAHALEKVSCYESVDLTHLNLIETYPSCFKSKSRYFDNFIVDTVRVLFRKITA